MGIASEIRARLLTYQKNEITEYHIYSRLAETIQSPENRQILIEIAEDEKRHYDEWKTYTGQDIAPD